MIDQAREHVVRGTELVEHQEALIRTLERAGPDVGAAHALLRTMYRSLLLMTDHFNRLKKDEWTMPRALKCPLRRTARLHCRLGKSGAEPDGRRKRAGVSRRRTHKSDAGQSWSEQSRASVVRVNFFP